MALHQVGARTEGDVYQGLFFWRQAADLLRPGSLVERVELEHDDADGVDDIAVFYRAPGVKIVSKYAVTVLAGGKPSLPDYGVSTHDVFKRISAEDVKAFYEQVKQGAVLARRAFDSQDRTESGKLWRDLFGSRFPKPPENGGGESGGSGRGGYTPPTGPAVPGSGRFA